MSDMRCDNHCHNFITIHRRGHHHHHHHRRRRRRRRRRHHHHHHHHHHYQNQLFFPYLQVERNWRKSKLVSVGT